MLEKIGIKEATRAISTRKDEDALKKSKPSQTTRKPKRPWKDDNAPAAPRRQSTRLKKDVVDPNESPTKRKRREVLVCLTVCGLLQLTVQVRLTLRSNARKRRKRD